LYCLQVLKIKDIVFKLAGDGATQYAEIELSGKTGQRTVPLIHSIPYVKDWIQNGHPIGSNPDAWLFVSGYTAQGRKSGFGGKLEYDRMYHQFAVHYRKEIFPRLIQDPVVPGADRTAITALLKKPWALYTFRHTGLTRKAKMLKEHHFAAAKAKLVAERYGLAVADYGHLVDKRHKAFERDPLARLLAKYHTAETQTQSGRRVWFDNSKGEGELETDDEDDFEFNYMLRSEINADTNQRVAGLEWLAITATALGHFHYDYTFNN